jgi:muramoyltetrapeptide carboxypeptidase LdcA involved in peptidoglycan recycling
VLAVPIIYPKPLRRGDTIAVTAPSSGVEPHLHHLLDRAREMVESLGYNVTEGGTIWTNDKCVSAPAAVRAQELQRFMLDPGITAIIPPWGGEFLMNILPLLDWEELVRHEPKWLLGFSDISTLTFAYTLITGRATAHGPNYVDIGSSQDTLTTRWLDVLATEASEQIEQISSLKYQSAWDFPKPGFRLDTETEWKVLGYEHDWERQTAFSGRLLGGCMDTISVLIGTPYAPVERFVADYAMETGLVWFLESCEMNAADIYRHLWQMKMCGWFERCSGLILGRPAGYSPHKNFELQDALHAVFDSEGFPVIYDADIGHIPPQLTLVNGALGDVSCRNGKGAVKMSFV